MIRNTYQISESEWVPFQGGQLEGRRPKALCRDCSERLRHAAASGKRITGTPAAARLARGAPEHSNAESPKHLLCFQCYRTQLERERALKAAGELDTASVERFQSALPFEPVDELRLERLKVERIRSREAI